MCHSVVSSIFTRCRDHYYHLNSRTFYSLPKKTPDPVVAPLHSFLSSPWQPLICFLSVWTCLFWTFRLSGIIQYVAFGVCLLWPSIMFEGSSTLQHVRVLTALDHWIVSHVGVIFQWICTFCLSIDKFGYLDYFHFLASRTITAANTCCACSCGVCVLALGIRISEISGHIATP